MRSTGKTFNRLNFKRQKKKTILDTKPINHQSSYHQSSYFDTAYKETPEKNVNIFIPIINSSLFLSNKL